MRPQLQRYSGVPDGPPGDCHRTCLAMILDLDRDDVPHFMADCPPGEAADSPASLAAEQAERDWLAGRGLTPVYVPYPGDLPLSEVLSQLRLFAKGAAVVLGCSSPLGNHSVVVYDGVIYNPAGAGVVAGPMGDGLWWVTIYAHATQPLREPKDRPDQVTNEYLPDPPFWR